MSDIPTREPEKITAGDYVQWKKESSACITPAGDECKASAGWTLTYALVKSGVKITITADASGDDFLITLSLSTTAAYDPGRYQWQAYVTGGSSERYMIDSGSIEILPNFAVAGAAVGYDDRSQAQKIYEAAEAMILGRATKDDSNRIVHGEVIGKMPIQRLLELRDKYLAIWNQEKAAERVADGLGHGSNIYVRFSDV